MATVQGMTLARALAMEAANVVDGYINGSGHLILVHGDATETDAGDASVSIADATTTAAGKVELATSAETITGTDVVRVVTPAGLAARFSDNFAGPVDVGTPANRDVMQWNGTAWVNVANVELVGYVRGTRSSTNGIFAARTTGDTEDRWRVAADGSINLGDGTTIDTKLYRSAANTLKTDDAFIAALGLTVSAGGAAITGNSTVTGDLNVTGKLTGAGKPFTVNKFTANGTYTKPSGGKWARVRAWGGAGAGGSCQTSASGEHAKGGGGQAGGYSESWIDLTSVTTWAIVIGAGGTAGAAGNNAGGNGGQTTVGGTVVTAPGGNGGNGGSSSSATFGVQGGNAGTEGTGDIATVGAPGGFGFGGGQLCTGGYGGSSEVGSGGRGPTLQTSAQSQPGVAGTGFAAGGGGAGTTSTGTQQVGGVGTAGLVIIETYY